MNFNKDYPIAILDTNIVIDYPYILDILKCNIVIPQTVLDELDAPNLKNKLKKENKYPKYFLNNLNQISDKTNLSKYGYKIENDCMIYLDADNLKHKEVNFNSKKPDLQFIAVAKNLKDKYGYMEIVIASQDGNLKIYANRPNVKVKTLVDFISEYIKYDDKIIILNSLYNINNKSLKNKEIENSKKQVIYKIILNILKNEKDINKLYELLEKFNSKEIYGKIYEALYKDKDINGLYKLSEKYKSNKMYNKIFEILTENKDINGLYELIKNYNYKPNREKVTEILTEHCNILADNKNIDGLYELAEKFNSKKIYERIFEILIENKDINELNKLYKKINEMDEKGIIGYKNFIKIISNKIKELESNK